MVQLQESGRQLVLQQQQLFSRLKASCFAIRVLRLSMQNATSLINSAKLQLSKL
jgi:hypothetical protein